MIQHAFIKIRQTFPPSRFYAIRYMNLIEIGPMIIEIQGIENGKLAPYVLILI